MSGNVVWSDGYDFPGEDLNEDNPPNTDKEDCGTSCLNNPECPRFSWETSRNCYHKRWSTTPTTKKTGARCGYIPGRPWTTSDSNFTWGQDYDFTGKDLPNAITPTSTVQECGESCVANSQCDHFIWHRGNCNLIGMKGQWDNNIHSGLLNTQCGYIITASPDYSTNRQLAEAIRFLKNKIINCMR